MADWYAYTLPVGAVLLGTIAYLWSHWESRRFDKRMAAAKAKQPDLFDKRHA